METDVKNLWVSMQKTAKTEYEINYREKLEENDTSTIGKQIAHYRNLQGLRQIDLAKQLGISRHTIMSIEQREFYPDLNILNKVLDFLDLRDKLVINDEYMKFILDNPSARLKAMRENMNLTQIQFSELTHIARNTINRWETGKAQISRKCFEKLMKL